MAEIGVRRFPPYPFFLRQLRSRRLAANLL